MDTEQIKNQYISVSLDDIVKQDRKDKKKSRSFNKANNNQSNGSPKIDSPKLNVLESSLDDIVKSTTKKPYIKKSHNNQHYQQQQQQQQQKYHQNFKVTVKNNNQNNNQYNNNNNNNNNRFGYQQPQQYNKGLFNRNMNNMNRQFSPQQNHHHRKFANHHNNNRLKNIPRTKITDTIDHKFFDPRGIRDYSNVKKPSTASMTKQTTEEDVDEPEYDEHGNELSFSVKVVNLPKTVIQSDIAYIFGVIGSLKDFELDTDKCEATVIFKKKSHALASIERYSGVELDGSLLILYETSNPLTKKQIDEKIQESISKNEQQQQQQQEEDQQDGGDVQQQKEDDLGDYENEMEE